MTALWTALQCPLHLSIEMYVPVLEPVAALREAEASGWMNSRAAEFISDSVECTIELVLASRKITVDVR